MSRNGMKTMLALTIFALLATAIVWQVAHDDDWTDRAGRTIMQSEIVRHPLAKGKEQCFLVTRKGAVAPADCDAFRDQIINPAPPELPEKEVEE